MLVGANQGVTFDRFPGDHPGRIGPINASLSTELD